MIRCFSMTSYQNVSFSPKASSHFINSDHVTKIDHEIVITKGEWTPLINLHEDSIEISFDMNTYNSPDIIKSTVRFTNQKLDKLDSLIVDILGFVKFVLGLDLLIKSWTNLAV